MTQNETLKILAQKGIIEGVSYSTRVSWSFGHLEEVSIEKFYFKNCVFEEDFRIANLKDRNLSAQFENCTFKKAFLINQFELFNLEIDACHMHEVTILESEIDEIDIKDTIIANYILLSGIKSDTCSIEGFETTQINQIYLASKEINTFLLDAKEGVKNLCIRAAKRVEIEGDLNVLEIDANEFDHITYTNKHDETHFKLEELTMGNLYFSGNLLFECIDVEKLNLTNVTCLDGGIRFNELNIKHADFENVNIESFFWNQLTFEKELTIECCNFNSLTYSNITWLKGKRVSDSFLKESIPIFYGLRKKWLSKEDCYNEIDLVQLRYERETYKQLKAAANGNHNYIEALDFYRNEMRLYWKEIRIVGGIRMINRVLIFMNRWSSDFGQNWILPIIGLIVFHLVFFSCIINWDYWSNSFTGSDEFREFAKLLNPTHETPKYINTGLGYITDLIMRVSVGYFVYHIIRATRKYGKI